MKKSYLVTFILLVGLILAFRPCWADETEERTLQGIEVLTGFGWAELKQQKDYHMYPLNVDFDFNLKKFTRKIGFNPPMLLQLQIEPFISGVTQPRSNVEAGNAFAVKVGLLPDTFMIQPYIKAAAGMLYMSQHTREQSTQFNFYEYGGAGLHVFFNKNTAITAEYRFRHVSNAGIDEPNGGINSQFALLGLAYQF